MILAECSSLPPYACAAALRGFVQDFAFVRLQIAQDGCIFCRCDLNITTIVMRMHYKCSAECFLGGALS